MSLAFQHSPGDVIRWLLVQLGLGSSPVLSAVWPVYNAMEPSMPDDCITTYTRSPRDDGRAMADGEEFRHYGVQIRVRAADEVTGARKAETIRQVLAEAVYLDVVTIGAVSYLVPCFCGNDIVYLGKDTSVSRRSLFTLNGDAAIRRTV